MFEVPYQTSNDIFSFEMVHQPYWVTHKWSTTLSPISLNAIDKFLPAKIRHKRIRKKLMEQIDNLVINNIENLRWVIYQSIDETFRRFDSMFKEQLSNAISATQGAIYEAMEIRKKKYEDVIRETFRLDATIQKLSEIRFKLIKRSKQ